MDNLIDTYCDVDDFCKIFIPEWETCLITNGEIKRHRVKRMSNESIKPRQCQTMIAEPEVNSRERLAVLRKLKKGNLNAFEGNNLQLKKDNTLLYCLFLKIMATR